MKKLTPILYEISVKVVDNTLEPLGVPDLHYRDQERPPKSRRFLRNILFFYIVSHAYISEVDKGIIPNPLLKIRYGQVHHIGSVLGS